MPGSASRKDGFGHDGARKCFSVRCTEPLMVAAKGRMPMAEDWAKMRDELIKGTISKGRREIPEKACARCRNFRQHSVSAAGDGHCTVIKEGGSNRIVFDNTDASSCPEYAEIERIRTDTGEFMWDTEFRPQRQLDEK